MKKLLIITLTAGLMLFSSIAALGAIHNNTSDFLNWSRGEFGLMEPLLSSVTGNATDTWYSVAPDKNVFKSNTSSMDNFLLLKGEYIINDQTFVGLGYLDLEDDTDPVTLTNLTGSYLFGMGLFIGLDYFDFDVYNGYTISPGYRLDIDDASYLALSLDYQVASDEDFNEIVGYEIDYAYYGDKAKFYLQYYSGTDEGLMGGDNAYKLGGAFQVNDEVVLGLNYMSVEDLSDYDAGLTWTPDFMTLDFKFGTIMEENYYDISGIYNLTEQIGLGIEYFSFDPINGERITLKFKYQDENSKFIFGYVPEDTYPESFSLSYKYNFK